MFELYKLPKLTYEYDALEPFFDARTMEIHHTKHHATYVNNLNSAFSEYSLSGLKLEDVLKDLTLVPSQVRNVIRNNGGGHWNHSFFWKILKLNTKPTANILQLIERDFVSLENFQNQFALEAKKLFGSGWAWLIINHQNKLQIVTTANQDTPLTMGTPLIGLDVWEHAYYLQYQNCRVDYIEAFFSVINWEQVENNLLK